MRTLVKGLRLSASDVREIEGMIDSHSRQEVARLFGCTVDKVSNVWFQYRSRLGIASQTARHNDYLYRWTAKRTTPALPQALPGSTIRPPSYEQLTRGRA